VSCALPDASLVHPALGLPPRVELSPHSPPCASNAGTMLRILVFSVSGEKSGYEQKKKSEAPASGGKNKGEERTRALRRCAAYRARRRAARGARSRHRTRGRPLRAKHSCGFPPAQLKTNRERGARARLYAVLLAARVARAGPLRGAARIFRRFCMKLRCVVRGGQTPKTSFPRSWR